MLSRWGGRPGKGGGFELGSFFQFKCLTPGKLTMVKRVQILHLFLEKKHRPVKKRIKHQKVVNKRLQSNNFKM